jgi:hypothetical protein
MVQALPAETGPEDPDVAACSRGLRLLDAIGK